MENYTIQNDNGRDYSFTGELIASAATSPNNACSNYSGSVGRWMELKMYRTEKGNYVCSWVERTQWQGERNVYIATRCQTDEEVIAFFKFDRLAKQIYEQAGIEADEVIE